MDTTNSDDLYLLDPYAVPIDKPDIGIPKTNPFFIETISEVIKIDLIFLKQEFKTIFILCLDNNFIESPENISRIKLFHQFDSDILELYAQKKLVTLIAGSFDLINHYNIRKGLLIIDKSTLEKFNTNCYDLGERELVYMMLETKEDNVKEWLDTYRISSFDDFLRRKIFLTYYKLSDFKIKQKLLNLISETCESDYWCESKNCKFNVNDQFRKRTFNLSLKWDLPIADIEKELNNILKNFKNDKKNIEYPLEILDGKITVDESIPDKIEDVDSVVVPKKFSEHRIPTNVGLSRYNGNSFYEMVDTSKLIVNKSDVSELLTGFSLTEQEKYYMICNLILSKNYCHYILNDLEILKSCLPILNKYKPIFNYLMGYAWFTFCKEESIRKNKITTTDRFVFDIRTACHLPVYPFCPMNPKTNPYFVCCLSDSNIQPNTNIMGVKQFISYQNGIVNIDEFRRRLNIFISGKEDLNLFKDFNWKNMVITGGAMAAIIPQTNPLMALFKKNPDPNIPMTEWELDRFFQEYYANSDIDIACNHGLMIDFIENVKNIRHTLYQNLLTILPNIRENDIMIRTIKSLTIFINSKILEEKCKVGEIPFSSSYIIRNRNHNDVKFYFYQKYLNIKTSINSTKYDIIKDKLEEPEYFEIINYTNFENTNVIIVDDNYVIDKFKDEKDYCTDDICLKYFLLDENDNIFIKFSEILKYKIASKYLKHSLEIFRITEPEFFSCIAKFHLACVRSYYNGETCYLLPSAISAYHTLTCTNFLYFVGSHDPISILNKYRKRGYGIILNAMERNQFLSYMMNMMNGKKEYAITESCDIKNIVGSLPIDHPFFKPRKFMRDEYLNDAKINLDGDYNDPKLDVIENIDDLIKYYRKYYKKYITDESNLSVINHKGNLKPARKWIIDAGYSLLK